MSKRKAGVNDIIYELDNEDVEISSDDEVKQPKLTRLEADITPNSTQSDVIIEESSTDVINIDDSCEIVDVDSPNRNIYNGGKTSQEILIIHDSPNKMNPKQTELQIDSKKNTDSKTTILHEDIVIDSPASNIDLGVVGCENRTPLVTVRFRDNKLASSYKKKIKAFMMKLIKLHEEETLVGSGNETDLELDIWPEDLDEDNIKNEPEEPVKDNLFFIDTDPCVELQDEIPRYSQMSTLISNVPNREPTPPPLFRRGPICFNCDGNHPLRDCIKPRDNARIAEKRKNMAVRVGRYHVEDEQKYGHLVPGRISGHLRHALGLKRHELPLHIYRMRLLGYPPGWLEEARISHSGITMFDSAGNAILDPEEEEGEVCEPGSKDKFDIKKILDFPGFNVPASPRYREEGHTYGLPPMSDQDSKMAMLQMLAPNAMKAYKRKKLTFFPSGPTGAPLVGQAEMDLDSGDEEAEFPSKPPLPDEAPPPPPPPPESPPPQDSSPIPLPESPPRTLESTEHTPGNLTQDKTEGSADEDIEVVEVMQVQDIPMPLSDLITIDVDDETSQQSGGRVSPSLDDLEAKKRLLLDALKGDSTSQGSADVAAAEGSGKDVKTNETQEAEEVVHIDVDDNSDNEIGDRIGTDVQSDIEIESKSVEKEIKSDVDIERNVAKEQVKTDVVNQTLETSSSQANTEEKSVADSDADAARTPNTKGRVKTTEYGTPVMNIASSYVKLPTDDKFSKDICDVINFENLPNSTGNYKKISTLLKKVKNEVDRIQES